MGRTCEAELAALLRREGTYSGVWFAEKLIEAADLLDGFEEMLRLLVDVRNDLYLNMANKTKPVIDKIDSALAKLTQDEEG